MDERPWKCICCSPPKPSRMDVIEVRYENGFVTRKLFVDERDIYTSEWMRVIQWRPLSHSAPEQETK